ncbi:MAG: glycosyltransferase family 2 protein [Chloroflexi bacterium]|mgnify:FL=1|jgi:glycosyltransferase involved in cell wall biosynthesis|nr:glycosyltransferase family 2 protein [Chloroflexota bacterium]
MDLSIVVPVYNEEENIQYLYDQLTNVLEPLGLEYEVLCADDGSSDHSFELLQELARRDHRIKVIRFRRNYGQTAGFSAGFDHATGDIVITIDADLQNDPASIPALLDKMAEGYDVVSGWRTDRKDALVSRKLPSRIANWLITQTTGVHVHDRGCSLRAHRLEIVRDMRLYGEMHRFIPDIAAWLGARWTEVPVNHRPRRFGKSKYGIGRTFRVLLDLITIRYLQGYMTRPIRIFGKWGVVLGGAGVLLGLWLTAQKLFMGQSLGNRPALVLAVLLMVMGLQLISIGLLGEMVMRTYYETQGLKTYRVREVVDFSRGTPDAG